MRTYQIELQGKPYTIKLRGYSVEINGTRHKLRRLPRRNILFMPMEYDLPIPEGKVMIVSGLWSAQLVVDGVNLSTGKPHTSLSKVPTWAYVLCILDFSLLLGGVVGGVIGAICLMTTLKISVAEEYNLGMRVVLSLGILLLGWIIMFAVAFFIAFALPGVYVR